MFKVLLYIGLFFCVSVVAFSQENMQLKTIVIDAGHGGKDPGALGKFVKEKDITLSVALKFGNLIK